MVILDEYMDVIDAIPAYIPPRFMNNIVHYYGDGINKLKSWQNMDEKKNETNMQVFLFPLTGYFLMKKSGVC